MCTFVWNCKAHSIHAHANPPYKIHENVFETCKYRAFDKIQHQNMVYGCCAMWKHFCIQYKAVTLQWTNVFTMFYHICIKCASECVHYTLYIANRYIRCSLITLSEPRTIANEETETETEEINVANDRIVTKKYQCSRDVKASLMKNKYHILATNPNARKKKSLNNPREVFNCAKNIICVFLFVKATIIEKKNTKRVKHKTITIFIHASLIFDLHAR